jgi:hypothetical protein
MTNSTYYANNNGNVKTYNNNRRSNPKNYVKEFTDFSKGYGEMISLVPEVKIYGGQDPDYNTVVQNLAKSIGENVPSYNNPNFPNTISFSVSSREVGFLTDERIAFGWRIYFNKDLGQRVYQMRVTFLSLSMSKRKYIDILEDNGWEENNEINKSSSFLRSISNSSHSYNNYQNRGRNYNQEEYPKNENSVSESLSKEEMDQLNNFAEDQQEVNNGPVEEYSIKKAPENNVYIIKYKDEEFVVDITNEDGYPTDFYTDFGERIVGYKNMKYDYVTGEVFEMDSEEDEKHKEVVFSITSRTTNASQTQITQTDLMGNN